MLFDQLNSVVFARFIARMWEDGSASNNKSDMSIQKAVNKNPDQPNIN